MRHIADAIICTECGEKWYKHGTTCKPKTAEANPVIAPVAVNSSEWVDALAGDWERRAQIINDERDSEDRELTGTVCTLRRLAKELRAHGGSASTEKLNGLRASNRR